MRTGPGRSAQTVKWYHGTSSSGLGRPNTSVTIPCHVPGALHLPVGLIAERAYGVVPRDAAVVTYCWAPACNGATRAALTFARLGYPADPLTAPVSAEVCGC